MPRWTRRAQRFACGAILVGVTVMAAVGCGSSSSQTTYYLALGDSLSVGIQPTKTGAQVRTDEGYVNDVYRTYVKHLPGLKLVQLGCPGDSTETLLTGHGNALAAKAYHCDRSGGSQLAAALAFIKAHRARVKLVSIDIGANDLNYCLTAPVLEQGIGTVASCVNAAERTLVVNLPKIFGPLKAALQPGTSIVAGGIYDPFLVGFLTHNKTLEEIAANSIPVVNTINADLGAAAQKAGLKMADVGTPFLVDDTARVSAPKLGGNPPKDLVVLCTYTYECAAKPQGPNIHPNSAGYGVIARAFEAVLPASL